MFPVYVSILTHSAVNCSCWPLTHLCLSRGAVYFGASASWEVNSHTVQLTGPVSTVLQLQLRAKE